MSNNATLDDIHAKSVDINKELYGIWLNEILFSWRWWLNIALTIIPWLIWIKYRDRKNTVRFSFVGLAVAGVTEFWMFWECPMDFGTMIEPCFHCFLYISLGTLLYFL